MKLLNSKAGVTVLEGVIALGLLAVVTAGAFGVLASASRKSSQPDIWEEMTLAVDKVKNLLQMYPDGTEYVDAQYKHGLCGGDDSPLGSGTHNIGCMLPPICDDSNSNSKFEYSVELKNIGPDVHQLSNANIEFGVPTGDNKTIKEGLYVITFNITCNGYEL